MADAGSLTFDRFDGSAPTAVRYDQMDSATLGALSLCGDEAARRALRDRIVGPPPGGGVAAKYNPAEPRDPHSGEWIHGAGRLLKRVEDVAVTDVGNGGTKLDFPGGPSVTLSGKQITRLYNVLNGMDLDPGDPVSTYKHPVERHTFKLAGAPMTVTGWGSYEDDTDRVRIEHGGAHLDFRLDLASDLAEHIANAAPDDAVQAAAGVDTHPGGEQLKPDPSIVEMLDIVQAAAGHDVTPGHDELHHYWTVGKGRARWVGSPTPWTTLLANLVEEVKDKPLSVLKKWTSRWFIEVFGYSSGSDLNRVAHGHPPRGKKVGPG